jgi:hypothetical protein
MTRGSLSSNEATSGTTSVDFSRPGRHSATFPTHITVITVGMSPGGGTLRAVHAQQKVREQGWSLSVVPVNSSLRRHFPVI